MSKNRALKKTISYLLTAVLLFTSILVGVPATNAHASEADEIIMLGVVENLGWLEGSTATATWEAVEGANYYEVKVQVYDHDVYLGEVETGTGESELDIQQEIYDVYEVSGSTAVVVKVRVSVKAYTIDQDVKQDLTGYSLFSEFIDYEIGTSIKIGTPAEVELSDSYEATWNVPEGYEAASLVYVVGDFEYGSIKKSHQLKYSNPKVNVSDGKCTMELSQNIKQVYGELGFTDEIVNLSVRVYYNVNVGSGLVGNILYRTSDFSENSNTIEYSGDIESKKIGTPTEVELSDSYEATWNVPEGYEAASLVYVVGDFEYGSIKKSHQLKYSNPKVNVSDGKCTMELSQNIKQAYGELGFTDEIVNLSVRVYYNVNVGSGLVGNILYRTSDFSENSNTIEYSGDIESKKIGTPTEVELSDSYEATWNVPEGYEAASLVYVVGDFEYGSIKKSRQLKYLNPKVNVSDGKCTMELSQNIKQVYGELGFTDEIVNLSVRVYYNVNVGSGLVGNILYRTSDFSENSNIVKYTSRKHVDEIHLAPSTPIIYMGSSFLIGKTITPEEAYYSSIDWTSDDSSIVSVDDMGKITGVAVGTANVTAKIGEVSATVPVTVYTIDSNIEDEKDKAEVTDTAGSIIDDIANNDNPDLGNTDIPEDKVDDIKQEIQDAVANGDTFHTDVKAIQTYFDTYKENWGQIQKAARELNAQFEGAYNIEVEMYHKNNDDEEHHIGNITELENEISFTFDLPTGMKEIETEETKKYVLVRVHKNSEGALEYSPIDFVINGDGTFTAKSNMFSDFVWLSVESDHEHIWNDGEVTKAPTCTEKGEKTYACTECEATKTEEVEVDATNHDYQKEVVAPTCTEQGYTEYTCKNCEDTYKEAYTEPAGHKWNEGEVTKAPTCTEKGEKTYACTVCEATQTEEVEVDGTKHDYQEKVVAPTCTEQGYTEYTCKNCEDTYKEAYTEAIGHKWNEGEVTKNPTCTEKGEKTYACTACEATKTEEVEVDATNHDYQKEVVAPTCTEQGYTEYTCKSCEDTYKEAYTEATGHKWNDGEVTKAPTCTEKGEKTYACTACEATKTEEAEVEATKHDYQKEVVAPTCTEQGYTEYTCKNCEDTYKEAYTEATGHKWNDGEVTKEPTYTEEGIRTFECTECHDTYEEAIPVIEKIIQTGWQKIDGKWYYVNADGTNKVGWIKDNNSWYFLDSTGAMKTGWQKTGNEWYYLTKSGAMATGWQLIGEKWYYFGNSGVMVTGWKKISNKWYYFDDGAMVSGWKKISNKWYYFDGGAMVTGWKKISNKWYYFETSGIMAASKWISDTYYVKADGTMAMNEWVGKYYVDANGKYVPGKTR